MYRIKIDDLSFCVAETINASQVCGGLSKKVYSGTGKGAWSASEDNAYGVAQKAGYSIDKKTRTIDAGVDVKLGYGVAVGVATGISDGEQYVSTNANASASLFS